MNKYPPRLTEEFLLDIGCYSSGLKDIVEDKTKECLFEMEKLEKEKEDSYVMLTQKHRRYNFDLFSIEFASQLIEVEFTEYYMQQKWIRHWLSLYEKIPEVKVPEYKKKYDDKFKLEDIKEKRIEDYYEGQLRKSNNRLLGNCPFHEEKSPSFYIFDDNHYHCFGCGVTGDVISFVMKYKKLNFKEACEYLK